MKNTFSKGFTLVELLIVITILAALAAAVVVVLNPAQLLAQARDAQRLTDMTTMRDAINLFITQTTAPNLCLPAAGGCSTGFCTVASAGPFQTACATNDVRLINGTGWVSVNFGAMVGGSPIAVLPRDPVSAGNFFYAYRATAAGLFELATRLESERHRGMMITDGGNQNTCSTFIDQGAWATPTGLSCYFEVGTGVLSL